MCEGRCEKHPGTGQCLLPGHLWRIIPGTGSSLELSSPPAVRMSCCTQIGEHQPDQPPRCRRLGWKLATLSGAVSAVGTMVLWWVARRRHSISSIVSVVSTRGGDTGASVTTVMSAQAVALLLFTWVQRGPKIVLSSCPECFMYISRCGL